MIFSQSYWRTSCSSSWGQHCSQFMFSINVVSCQTDIIYGDSTKEYNNKIPIFCPAKYSWQNLLSQYNLLVIYRTTQRTISQGSAVTRLRRWHLYYITNLLLNLKVKKIEKFVSIWQSNTQKYTVNHFDSQSVVYSMYSPKRDRVTVMVVIL